MINKAFVINLDSKPEQFYEVQEAFLPYGIECERYIAIRHSLKQIGCTMSQLDIIQRAKKEQWPYVLVIEDDCVPQKEMKEWPAISRYLMNHKKEWEVFLGGSAYVHPQVLRNDFQPEKESSLDIIECSDGVMAHFAVYNESSYDRLLAWYDLPMPEEERPIFDIFMTKNFSRIWMTSPFIAWQKSHDNVDQTEITLHAEEKLKYFSEEIRKSRKARWLGRLLKKIS